MITLITKTLMTLALMNPQVCATNDWVSYVTVVGNEDACPAVAPVHICWLWAEPEVPNGAVCCTDGDACHIRANSICHPGETTMCWL